MILELPSVVCLSLHTDCSVSLWRSRSRAEDLGTAGNVTPTVAAWEDWFHMQAGGRGSGSVSGGGRDVNNTLTLIPPCFTVFFCDQHYLPFAYIHLLSLPPSLA